MKKILKEYRIELIALLAVLLGIFLLVEQFNIRESLLQAAVNFVAWIKKTGADLRETLEAYVMNFTLSDLTGWVLIISASIFIIWRIRYRFTTTERWRAENCPRCHSMLFRVHRSKLDRVLTFVIFPHAHRYLCSNEGCGWTGLRRRQYHSKKDELKRL